MVLCWKGSKSDMKKGYETKEYFEAIVTALQITLIYNLIIYKRDEFSINISVKQ